MASFVSLTFWRLSNYVIVEKKKFLVFVKVLF